MEVTLLDTKDGGKDVTVAFKKDEKVDSLVKVSIPEARGDNDFVEPVVLLELLVELVVLLELVVELVVLFKLLLVRVKTAICTQDCPLMHIRGPPV